MSLPLEVSLSHRYRACSILDLFFKKNTKNVLVIVVTATSRLILDTLLPLEHSVTSHLDMSLCMLGRLRKAVFTELLGK